MIKMISLYTKDVKKEKEKSISEIPKSVVLI